MPDNQYAGRIDEQRLRLLLMQAPVSNAVLILVALLFAVVLADSLIEPYLWLWAVLLSLVSGARLLVWWQHRQNPAARSTEDWLKRYIALTWLLGPVWSLIYLLGPADGDIDTLGALFMLYFGATVAAQTILSISPPTFLAYTLPSTLTFEWLLLGLDGEVYSVMMWAVLLFYAMIWLFTWNSNRQWNRMMELELHNSELIDALRIDVESRDQLVNRQTRDLEGLNVALVNSEQQLKNVLSGANLGFWDWYFQTGQHEVNDRWLEMLGLDRSDIRNDVHDWEDRIHPEDRQRMLRVVEKHIRDHTGYVEEFRMRHKDGHWVWIEGSGAVVEYAANGEAIRLSGTHQEVTERKTLEQQLAYRADHDSLTGLLNRGALWERLDTEISRAARHARSLCLFMVDIDHFKRINDVHGHKIGDLVLHEFSSLLKDGVRKMDLALRYGGEEFIVVLPETEIEAARELAERLHHLIRELVIKVDDQQIRFTISIGIASFPHHAEHASELVDAADEALYAAKSAGRNRTVVAAKP